MTYENIQIDYPNFCLGSRAGTILTVDTDASTSYLYAKRLSDGLLISSYELNPSFSASTEIKSIQYVGPNDLSDYYNGLLFFTLQHNSDSQCTITEWELDVDDGFLYEQRNLVFDDTDVDKFNCHTMAIEKYTTSFTLATVTGTGYIEIDEVGKIDVGTKLFLGPSTATSPNNGQSESVWVTSISGSVVYITSSGVVPPSYVYMSGDPISYYKDLYLFSDYGYAGDTASGTLYKIDVNSGSVVDKKYSGIYANVRASSWSDYYDMVGFVRGSSLLYIDVHDDNWDVKRSHTPQLMKSDKTNVTTVYDIIFYDNNIYRLQSEINLRDDYGNFVTSDWSTYNYHQDTSDQYSYSISLRTLNSNKVHNQERVTIQATVRNQYGAGLLNKIVYFTKTGDSGGNFTPLNGQVTTDANGVAEIIYDVGYNDPTIVSYDFIEIPITASTDGGSTYLGVNSYTGQVVDSMSLYLFNKYTYAANKIYNMPSLSGTWPSAGSDLYQSLYMYQREEVNSVLQLPSRSKFQFPGGDWFGTTPPQGQATTIDQRPLLSSDAQVVEISEEFIMEKQIRQEGDRLNSAPLSQNYVSRHLLTGHQDSVDVDQFTFVVDAIPAMWSYKNPVDSDIWIRLAPQAYSLNPSSVIMQIREVSYAGDTDYIDITSLCDITTYDAGGGIQGVDISYENPTKFHNSGVVYVVIIVYDTAPIPNIITLEYWFRIIPDYKSPYIVNEYPERGEEDVDIETSISFDVIDVDVGVDISSLKVYVNNKTTEYTYVGISNGYHVILNLNGPFIYGQKVEIYVQVEDASDNSNVLYDMWQFYCVGSDGPWFDRDSFYPVSCSKGLDRRHVGIYFNVYAVNGTGLDPSSIWVSIGGKERNVKITPVVLRIK